MARNKYPEITHGRILDAATKLFFEKGWAETTIQDIVDELGDVTRGAFYHHFKSKNDIIDAVATRMFYHDNVFEDRLMCPFGNGLERLKYVLKSAFEDEKKIKFIRSAGFFVRDPKMIKQQMDEAMESVAPQLCKLIEEGIADGSIHIQYPKQAAQSLLLLANIWMNPVIFAHDCEEYMQKVYHFKALYDGIGLYAIDEEIVEGFKVFYQKIHAPN